MSCYLQPSRRFLSRASPHRLVLTSHHSPFSSASRASKQKHTSSRQLLEAELKTCGADIPLDLVHSQKRPQGTIAATDVFGQRGFFEDAKGRLPHWHDTLYLVKLQSGLPHHHGNGRRPRLGRSKPPGPRADGATIGLGRRKQSEAERLKQLSSADTRRRSFGALQIEPKKGHSTPRRTSTLRENCSGVTEEMCLDQTCLSARYTRPKNPAKHHDASRRFWKKHQMCRGVPRRVVDFPVLLAFAACRGCVATTFPRSSRA